MDPKFRRRALISLPVVALAGGLWNRSCQRERTGRKLGVILSLTGPGSQYGRMVLDGVEVAISELNATRPSGEWNLVVEDDATDPRIGFNAAQKLLTVDKVPAIIGPIASSVALTVAPVAERHRAVMLSPAASTPLLTGISRFVFRIYPSDSYDGAFLGRAAASRLGLKTVAILYINNDFGAGLAKTFATSFEGLGGQITKREPFAQGTANFRSQLTRLSDPVPGGVFLIGTVNDYIVALRQMRELSLRSRVLAPVTFDDPAILQQVGSGAEGVVYSRPKFDANADSGPTGVFGRQFRTARSKAPSILNALGYDSIKILVPVLEAHVGDSIPDALRKTVHDGASGRIEFDSNGDVVKELELLEITKGKPVPIRN